MQQLLNCLNSIIVRLKVTLSDSDVETDGLNSIIVRLKELLFLKFNV